MDYLILSKHFLRVFYLCSELCEVASFCRTVECMATENSHKCPRKESPQIYGAGHARGLSQDHCCPLSAAESCL
ncbi:hypothetical protein CEXT_302441 [Caerostris extrusa]|uniref:Uncharacterized protein n=1 Tax=Caerostris extrusa TaxID=172846 RepID=A0AAV4XQ54_CAEEX|nr:hypothetical protein CEXT_302441 [Caerostris extrusa]